VKRAYLQEVTGAFDFRIAFISAWFQSWIAYDEEYDRYPSLRTRLDVSVDIEVDVAGGEVRVQGQPVRLSAQEFDILNCLAMHAGQLVRREELIDAVWKTDQGVSDQVVDTAFYRLRRKIGDQGQYIETIPGQGFKLHRAARLTAGVGGKK
jgi:DNA-binding response OmpR family regulator